MYVPTRGYRRDKQYADSEENHLKFILILPLVIVSFYEWFQIELFYSMNVCSKRQLLMRRIGSRLISLRVKPAVYTLIHLKTFFSKGKMYIPWKDRFQWDIYRNINVSQSLTFEMPNFQYIFHCTEVFLSDAWKINTADWNEKIYSYEK